MKDKFEDFTEHWSNYIQNVIISSAEVMNKQKESQTPDKNFLYFYSHKFCAGVRLISKELVNKYSLFEIEEKKKALTFFSSFSDGVKAYTNLVNTDFPQLTQGINKLLSESYSTLKNRS